MSKVLVLGGSIRAKRTNQETILNLAQKSTDLDSYRKNIQLFLKQGNRLCNSEILAGAALVGAHAAGAKTDYFPLIQLFPPKDCRVFQTTGAGQEKPLANIDTMDIDKTELEVLLNALEESSGIILATPVYFGDRSSVANKFLQLASVRERVQKKVYGVVSVGAKRNGGQETCNVFSLYEMLNQGALGVGNGLPTSQYGGTAVGGDMGKVADDEWGLSTALGTGVKVAQTAAFVDAGLKSPQPNQKTKIVMLVAMDTKNRELKKCIETLTQEASDKLPNTHFTTLNLVDNDIYRCLGCDVCPKITGTQKSKPQCVISDSSDYLEEIRQNLCDADAFIVCGVNPTDIEDLITRYQVMTERMRHIRRNDYELSNTLIAGLCLHKFGATINPIHSLKVMVSYIRHNTIMHRPIEIFQYNGQILDNGLNSLLDFCQSAKLLAAGRSQIPIAAQKYEPYGEGGGYIEKNK